MSTILSTLGYSLQKERALFGMMDIAGLFAPEKLWHALTHLEGSPDEVTNLESPAIKSIYRHMVKTLQVAHSKIGDEKYAYLAENLFSHQFLDAQDQLELLTYLRQTAFARPHGKERHEIATPEWATSPESVIRFLKQAHTFGTLAEKEPTKEVYKQTWVLGAWHSAFNERLQYLRITQDQGVSHGRVRILAGERHLSIGEDGEEIMQALSSIPSATESDLGRHLYHVHMEEESPKETVVHTEKRPCGSRPNTETTIRQAVGELIQEIKDNTFGNEKEFHIMVVSNRPYLDRQVQLAQRVVNEELKKAELSGYSITLDGVSPPAATIYSLLDKEAAHHPEEQELLQQEATVIASTIIGALSAEEYLTAIDRIGTKRTQEQLMFQPRQKIEARIEGNYPPAPILEQATREGKPTYASICIKNLHM